MVCMICGCEEDLTTERLVCAMCTTRFMGSQQQTVEEIERIRRMMGLGAGEYCIPIGN